ncbi:replication initiation and membrane attachment family protein [Oenococcus oeni]|uniref:Helicase loader DnaB n=1 Tax=Oenococcus oeni TaxID=1247 RepID=A0AAQ2ZEZ3_OENOE|nr:DnaD domain protein [Oenococcus oeni]EJO00072.1 replicative DNA helicase loader DnaB [Oenococcus oeni AWRIB418]KEP88658.1 replicative DNA helicase loader DnaB [Oenococcus oeni IOEB_0501]KGH60818.1 helicase DnaB [Oenococcus oeni IOEB_9805]KGH74847.1 helicase DnaB [Oenococcus oeni IOEB_9803]KGH79216.1 helicase DnaB [Oenococcus oeni IOEB_8417]
MIERQTQLNAYWNFIVNPVSFDSNDLKNLTRFYLPLIGVDSFSTYFQLLDSGETSYQINDLLDLLNISLTGFDDARKKLEATGLLNSYLDDRTLLFKLKKPLSRDDFFSDDLLSSFFFSVVGEERFQIIVDGTKKTFPNFSGIKLNANFYEAFGDLSLKKPKIDQSQFKKTKKSFPNIDADDFDFSIIEDNLKKYGVSETEISKEHNFIVSQHLIYGFSEEQILDLLANSLLIDKKTIEHSLFRQQINKLASKPQKQAEKRDDSGLSGQLSNDERQLVKAAQSLAPYQFLAQLKQVRGGIVTSSEQKNLEHLFDLGLAPEVINILTHQVIIGMESSNLPAPLSQAIADSFLQAKVKNAAEAILSIKSRQKKQNEKHNFKNGPLQKEKKIDYGTAEKVDNQIALDALAKYQHEKKNS